MAGNKSSNTKKKNNTVEASVSNNRTKLVMLIAVIAIALLLQFSVFGFCGAFGAGSRIVLFGIFGVFAYIFPIAVAFGVWFSIANSNNKKSIQKLVCAVSAWIFLSVLIELFLHGDDGLSGVAAFDVGRTHHSGGGFIGGLIGGLLVHLFGMVGAYLISFALLVICLVLLSDGMAFDKIGLGSDDADIKRRKRELKRAERIARKERERGQSREYIKNTKQVIKQEETNRGTAKTRSDKFDGITADTTLIPADSRKSDEVSEIRYTPDENTHDVATDEPSTVEVKEVSIKSDPDEPLGSYSAGVEEVATEPEPIHKQPVAESKTVAEAKPKKSTSAAKVKEADNIPEPVVVEENKDYGDYEFPPVSLLSVAKGKSNGNSGTTLEETKHKLETILANFGVNVTVTDVSCGPTVTRYELQPEMGVKVSKIVNLADDIKLNLAAADIRIEAPIPGKAAVGIEVPNKEATVVSFRELIESAAFKNEKSPIAFAAGKDIGGNAIVANIAKMPHVLIAGATGSGKSVCINTIIMSILYRAHPDEVKFIMIDPKVVELSVYNGIPHLLTQVVTDPKKAAGALQWAVNEMMQRYDKFAQAGVRNMEGYNAAIKNGYITYEVNGEKIHDEAERMPQIVVIVDELADLMMVASKEVEESICRLAQLARAAGIHLVIATQRPSVNVITGLIKANMPSRIAFAVTSGVDSRTILDMVGAEKLLGKGDMLYYPQGYSKPVRAQGAFLSDGDVAKVVDFIKAHNGNVTYDENINNNITEQTNSISEGAVEISQQPSRDDGRDKYFDEAARLLIDKEKGSIGMLQRYFKIGFNRAARIMDQLEEAGVVGPEEGTKPRRVLMTLADFEGNVSEDEAEAIEDIPA